MRLQRRHELGVVLEKGRSPKQFTLPESGHQQVASLAGNLDGIQLAPCNQEQIRPNLTLQRQSFALGQLAQHGLLHQEVQVLRPERGKNRMGLQYCLQCFHANHYIKAGDSASIGLS